ncbi:hypothetical protein IAT40_007028 [Kwoniella sp. CBS 6097]
MTTDPKGHSPAAHGLLLGHPPPSREILDQWLDQHCIKRDERLEITSMEDGSGWRVVAKDDMDLGELICAVPKSALLSHKTTSLPPLPDLSTLSSELKLDSQSLNSYTILHLSLCLLHEFRLGTESPFYGYLQSLPREIIGLPLLWDVEDIRGEDGRLAREWLQGTEVEKELERRAEQGLSLATLKAFYTATSGHLPPTPSHPTPSPFLAYLHCFALISTRAFMTDIYHLIALCPFADILNHSSSSTSHTSMMADDFVCHTCGSLAPCPHDITNPRGVPYRLAHLGEREIERIEREEDSVDMRIERSVIRGEEVWNCYGEGLGDARLLVEWGFISGDFAGEGLTWGLDELGLSLGFDDSNETEEEAEVEKRCSVVESIGSHFKQSFKRRHTQSNHKITEHKASNSENDEDEDEEDEDDDDDERLLCPPSEQDDRLLNLDQSGRLSVNIFAHLWMDEYRSTRTRRSGVDAEGVIDEQDPLVKSTSTGKSVKARAYADEIDIETETEVHRSIEVMERAWSTIGLNSPVGEEHVSIDDTSQPEQSESEQPVFVLDGRTRKVVERIKVLLRQRLQGLYNAHLSDEELFDLKDNLEHGNKYTEMAMNISINERILLRSALERWEQL